MFDAVTRARLIMRRVSGGATMEQSAGLLAELEAAHDGDNLAAALAHHGFATAPRAQVVVDRAAQVPAAEACPCGKSHTRAEHGYQGD